jgi:FHA domain
MSEGDTRKLDQNHREHQRPDLPERRPNPDVTKLYVRSENAGSGMSPGNVDSPKTELWGRSRKKTTEGTDQLSPASKSGSENQDPVVGWLVIVKGPGHGNALRLGYHWNSIGRDADQRVCLNFGDIHISRRNHAKLNYEPRSRKFMITIGDGMNPIYVRSQHLLAPTELKTGDRIQIGETELMFVALCSETFDWESNS